MHLAQHHFQAQANYLESSRAFAFSSLFFRPHGFLRLRLDQEAIRQGTVAVLEGWGVMPDGLTFEFPQGDPLPPPRAAEGSSLTGGESLTVLLAIPAWKADRGNCALPGEGRGEGERRFLAEPVKVPDEITGQEEREVLLARKNFRILLQGEPADDLVTLPMAQVRRGPDGHLEYLVDFIPMSLHIGAGGRLPAILGGLVEMLRGKAQTLAQRRAMVGDDLSDLSSEEILSYWMSHAIHSGLAALSHLTTLTRCHPEELYREMARLAGSLATFSTESEASDLPAYDHENLTDCFSRLDARIRRLLQVMVPEGFILIRLDPRARNVKAALLQDARVFRKCEWLLRVSGEGRDSEVLRNVPALVKVCSAEDIVRLVEDANPGLPLEHVAQLPASVPRRLGSHYFRIVKTGPCWQLIQARSSVGVYIPDVLSGVEMELVVVQQ
jgi:type VI secretion system protein ImpJ